MDDGSGLFASYHSFATGWQYFYWLNNSGVLQHYDSLEITNSAFAYSQNGSVHILEEASEQIGNRTVRSFVKHSFTNSGLNLGNQLIHQDTLLDGEQVSGSAAYDLTDDLLTIAAVSVDPLSSPVTYMVQLIQHTPQSTVVRPAWNPGPIPIGAFGYAWAVASAPWGNGVFGFNMQTETASQFWFQTYDAEGIPTRYLEVIPLAAGENVNGLDITVSHETVYGLYTTFTGNQSVPAGAWILGFPLENILSIDVNFSPIPDKISFYAFPNPFNSTINFELHTELSNLSSLIIYSSTGREVKSFNLKEIYLNNRRISWSPKNLPSGIYFAKLESQNQSLTQKILLLK